MILGHPPARPQCGGPRCVTYRGGPLCAPIVQNAALARTLGSPCVTLAPMLFVDNALDGRVTQRVTEGVEYAPFVHICTDWHSKRVAPNRHAGLPGRTSPAKPALQPLGS